MTEFVYGNIVLLPDGRTGVVVDERRYSGSGVGVQPEMQLRERGGSLAGNPETGGGIRPEMGWSDALLNGVPVFVRVHDEQSPRWFDGTTLKLVGSGS